LSFDLLSLLRACAQRLLGPEPHRRYQCTGGAEDANADQRQSCEGKRRVHAGCGAARRGGGNDQRWAGESGRPPAKPVRRGVAVIGRGHPWAAAFWAGGKAARRRRPGSGSTPAGSAWREVAALASVSCAFWPGHSPGYVGAFPAR
jgi:hypothetical protein